MVLLAKCGDALVKDQAWSLAYEGRIFCIPNHCIILVSGCKIEISKSSNLLGQSKVHYYLHCKLIHCYYFRLFATAQLIMLYHQSICMKIAFLAFSFHTTPWSCCIIGSSQHTSNTNTSTTCIITSMSVIVYTIMLFHSQCDKLRMTTFKLQGII